MAAEEFNLDPFLQFGQLIENYINKMILYKEHYLVKLSEDQYLRLFFKDAGAKMQELIECYQKFYNQYQQFLNDDLKSLPTLPFSVAVHAALYLDLIQFKDAITRIRSSQGAGRIYWEQVLQQNKADIEPIESLAESSIEIVPMVSRQIEELLKWSMQHKENSSLELAHKAQHIIEEQDHIKLQVKNRRSLIVKISKEHMAFNETYQKFTLQGLEPISEKDPMIVKLQKLEMQYLQELSNSVSLLIPACPAIANDIESLLIQHTFFIEHLIAYQVGTQGSLPDKIDNVANVKRILTKLEGSINQDMLQIVRSKAKKAALQLDTLFEALQNTPEQDEAITKPPSTIDEFKQRLQSYLKSNPELVTELLSMSSISQDSDISDITKLDHLLTLIKMHHHIGKDKRRLVNLIEHYIIDLTSH